MISSVQNHSLGNAPRLVICAALALAVTSITTQVIASSAGQHEYGVAPTNLTASDTTPDSSRRITLAQARSAVAGSRAATGPGDRGLLQSTRSAQRAHSFRP
jgi:hypothetical protein